MKENFLHLSHWLIGIGFFVLYVHHVRSIFEIRTNIAILTQFEREALLRREDALHYAFYKTLTAEPDFWSGYQKLKNVTDIEYPNSVNVLKRFHVMPEIIIGFFYHMLRGYTNIEHLPFTTCWRSDEVDMPIELRRCVGLKQPMQFYLETVWLLSGFTTFVVYLYAILLSENIFGGIYAVLSYLMFHGFASNIYERPMARENFAFPFIFMQMYHLCDNIERSIRKRKYRMRLKFTSRLTLLTTISLLCWQFSAVIFAIQVLIMMTPWKGTSLSYKVSTKFCNDYAASQLVANILAYCISHGNKQYIFAWQVGPTIGLFFISTLRQMMREADLNEFSLRSVAIGVLMAVTLQGTIIDMFEKYGLAISKDNTYAFYRDLLIHWILQARVNFATGLAACSVGFQRMDWIELWDIIETLVVKPYCFYGVVMLAKFFRKWRKSSEKSSSITNTDHIERAKKYVLEEFMEENHIKMSDIADKKFENDLNECYKLLEQCNYDYDRYKEEKIKLKKPKPIAHSTFMSDVKKLQDQIKENESKKRRENNEADEENATTSTTTTTTTTINPPEETNEASSMLTDDNASEPPVNPQIIPEPENEPSTSNTSEQEHENENEAEEKNDTKTPSPNTSVTSCSSVGNKDNDSAFESDFLCFQYLYTFQIMVAFTILGLTIRKLFFMSFTLGCVVASTVCSSKFWYRKQRNLFWSVSLVVFITSIVSTGVTNIHEEYYPTNYEARNEDFDNLIYWIKSNTEKNAVFAGPIDIIGTVYLTTKRPIVNHAHLQMRQIIERTEQVYSVYSRQQSSDIYNQCAQLKIQYLIISMEDCAGGSREECDILSIWDNLQPAFRKYPQFCSDMTNRSMPSFLRAYTNNKYVVLKMFSQSVQINLKYNKMPEKSM